MASLPASPPAPEVRAPQSAAPFPASGPAGEWEEKSGGARASADGMGLVGWLSLGALALAVANIVALANAVLAT